jgi:hypothetical protein
VFSEVRRFGVRRNFAPAVFRWTMLAVKRVDLLEESESERGHKDIHARVNDKS